MIDPTTGLDAAGVAALIFSVVQLVKPFIAGKATTADKLHVLSAALGGLLVPAAELTAPGASVTAQNIFQAVCAGFSLGAGVTVAVAAAKSAPAAAKTVAAKVPRVSLSQPASVDPENKPAGV
jgi:Na+-driven multidrug efflux pump